MHNREIATLTFKLMAMFVAFGAVSSAQSVFNNWYAFPSGTRLSLVLPFILSAGIALAMGLLVWMSSDSIAKSIYPAVSAEAAPGTSFRTAADIMQLAIGIIGVWVVITTAPSLINWIALYLFSLHGGYESVMGPSTSASSARPQEVFDIQAKVNILSTLAELMIGLVFALMPGRVVNALDQLRAKMVPSPRPESDDTEDATGERGE